MKLKWKFITSNPIMNGNIIKIDFTAAMSTWKLDALGTGCKISGGIEHDCLVEEIAGNMGVVFTISLSNGGVIEEGEIVVE